MNTQQFTTVSKLDLWCIIITDYISRAAASTENTHQCLLSQIQHFFGVINMIYFVFEPLSNGSRVLPISTCICGSASEAASVWYVTMLPGHLLYISINKCRPASFTVSFPRDQGWVDVFTLCSLYLLKRHALETHHGYTIVFIINSTNTIWRPLCPICKHMPTLREGAESFEILAKPASECLNFLNGAYQWRAGMM